MRSVRIAAFLVLCSAAGFGQVTHVATGCTTKGNPAATSGHYTFSCTPNAVNDGLAVAVECSSASSLTNVTLSDTGGWNITRRDAAAGSAPFGSTAAGWVGLFGVIATSSGANTFTATFTGDAGGNCGNFTFFGSEEFSGEDTTGGSTTFDASVGTTATSCGTGATSITPANANDAVWFVCIDSLPASGWTGTGYSQGVNDAGGEAAEYKILTGGSGTPQTVLWTGSSGTGVIGGLTVKPAGGGGGSTAVRHRGQVF